MPLKKIAFVFCSIFYGLLTNSIGQVRQLDNSIAPPSHPRILLLKAEEVAIKNVIEKDSTWRAVHHVIINECDRILTKPLTEYKLEGKRLLRKSRECRKRVFFLSYAWRTTGNKKYLSRAEQELLNVSSFKDWNPAHFLDVAEMTMAVSIGYDWLYDDLSVASRIKIRDAIIKKGLEPSLISDNSWWITEDNNWNQVCNAGMVFGALAVFEDNKELARKIINRSIESIQLPMKANYDPDGAFSEGYAYWTYGTTFNVYLINLLERAFNSDFGLMEKSNFYKTAAYLTNMIGPAKLNFNYSDTDSKSILNPAMFWFASRLKDYSLLFSEKELLSDRDELSSVRDLPVAIIWGMQIDMMKVPEPKNLIWVGQGKNPVALMRSSWKKDGIFVGLKGGSASNGHAHMDIGSFVMDALGERWAMDFGPQEYNSLESEGVDLWSRKQDSQRWQVFRYNNKAHNTLTINNELQQVKGHASIEKYSSKKMFLAAEVNLKQVYEGEVSKAHRGVAIVDQQYVVVRDELYLPKPSSVVRWTMLTAGEVKITSKTTAEILLHGKKLLLKIQEPKGAVLKTWSTQPPHDYDAPNPGTNFIGFDVKFLSKGSATFTVLLIPEDGKTKVSEKPVQPLDKWFE